MKSIFDNVSKSCSKAVTRAYSTSFSLGIGFLDRSIHAPIYGIYGFVRLADEIVDSFEGYKQEELFIELKQNVVQAIEDKISLNPILNSFQEVVHQYNIEWSLIESFLHSMEMDLNKSIYDRSQYDTYILGSAEVVGLMCLRVFVNGDTATYESLKPSAMRLGAAFQKVNFLRDAKADFEELGRTYFPGVSMQNFSNEDKGKIEAEVEEDFKEALKGIRQLPRSSRKGVYLAYIYYYRLFKKIKRVPASRVLTERIRIPNSQKISLMFYSLMRHQLNLL